MTDTKSEEPKPKSGNRFIRLSSAGIQMGITIFLGASLGKYLDEKYPNEKNWWTAGLTIFAVAIALYNLIRQVNKLNSDDK